MEINWHFTDDEYAKATVEGIIEAFGESFAAPFDGSLQPLDTSLFNAEALLQFDLPANLTIMPSADTSMATSISAGINSLMSHLAPLMTAYGFLMPIFQVIIGIIEVLCALMNPFAVKRAVKRLLKNYIPALVKLFPGLAYVVLILSIIKLIMAAVVFILTVVIPFLKLLYNNAKLVNDAISDYSIHDYINQSSDSKINAGKQKINDLIKNLINELAILKTLQPILDIVLAIFRLWNLKWPCKKDCCDADVCPEVLSNPPSGRAIIWPTSYKDSEANFAFRVVTTDPRIKQLKKYNDDSVERSNPQSVEACCPAGTELDDCPNFVIRITGGRGQSEAIDAPVVKISGSTLTVINPNLINLASEPAKMLVEGDNELRVRPVFSQPIIKNVNFEILPNYDMLMVRGIIGIGCHPEIVDARIEAEASLSPVDYDASQDPDVTGVGDDFNNFVAGIGGYLGDLQDATGQVPYDLDKLAELETGLINYLFDYLNGLKKRIQTISAKTLSLSASVLDVNKTVVRSDNQDFAVVSITPKDRSGNILFKNVPADAILDMQAYTTFGTLSNKRFDKATGSMLFDLKSPMVGTAEITAKIDNKFIVDVVDGVDIVRKLNVRFVADSVLPTRRKVSATVDKELKRG